MFTCVNIEMAPEKQRRDNLNVRVDVSGYVFFLNIAIMPGAHPPGLMENGFCPKRDGHFFSEKLNLKFTFVYANLRKATYAT